MNGIVVTGKYTLTEKIKLLFGIIKREEKKYNNKEIYIYKIPSVNKRIYLRLIKKLKKDNISSLALENGFDKSWQKEFERDFNIINKEKIFADNLGKLIKKAANSMGIKKGSLSLGIKSDEADIISGLKELKNILKCIYLYTGNPGKVEKKTEEFYMSTGVPVVIKKEAGENQCDILVLKDNEISKPADSIRLIINLSKKPCYDSRSIEDIRVYTPFKLIGYGVNDCVVNELFGIDFNVKGFIKKMLDTDN